MKKDLKKKQKPTKSEISRTAIQIGAFLLSVFLGFVLTRVFVQKLGLKVPELFPITGANQAYFELVSDKTAVTAGEDVQITVKLATSGEDFDAAIAILEWDPSQFSFKSASGALSAQWLKDYVKDDLGRMFLMHFALTSDPPMNTPNNQLADFATVVLTALVDNPSNGVKLSQTADDLGVHFVGRDSSENGVNQTLADQNKTSIVYGPPVLVSPEPLSGASLSLLPSSLEAAPGDEFSFDVLLSTGAETARAADVIVKFDSSLLEFLDFENTQTYGFFTITEPQISDGRIVFGALGPTEGVEFGGEAVLARIGFRVKPGANETTTPVYFDFIPGSSIDSNVSHSPAGQGGVDILGQVYNSTVSIVSYPSASPSPSPTVCPADTQTCPDGTVVGRVLPDCEFADCPSPTESPLPASPSPSPSPDPENYYQVNIDIDLEVKPNDSSDNVLVRLLNDNDDVIDSHNIASNAEGAFGIGINPDDVSLSESYRLFVKPEGYLSQVARIVFSEGPVNAVFAAPFLTGDFNETSYNMVNSLDYPYFVSRYNTNDNLADMNGDGLVNSLDFSIFVRNYNKIGEE